MQEMQETWVHSLGGEDPLEKSMTTHSSILAWRIHEQRNLVGMTEATEHVHLLSCVQLFATPWTEACQAPLFMDSPGKNTGMGCHFLLQGIFPSQGSNPCLLLGRWILYH